MQDIVTVIQTLGFPIACVMACGTFIYKIVLKDKTEAVDREAMLINMNNKSTEALDRVANTIEASNTINRELSETNRMLVEKVELTLVELSSSVCKILDKLDR